MNFCFFCCVRSIYTHFPVIHYMPELFKKITDREFDPTEIISHRIPLDQVSEAYEMFNNHQDECTKVILKP